MRSLTGSSGQLDQRIHNRRGQATPPDTARLTGARSSLLPTPRRWPAQSPHRTMNRTCSYGNTSLSLGGPQSTNFAISVHFQRIHRDLWERYNTDTTQDVPGQYTLRLPGKGAADITGHRHQYQTINQVHDLLRDAHWVQRACAQYAPLAQPSCCGRPVARATQPHTVLWRPSTLHRHPHLKAAPVRSPSRPMHTSLGGLDKLSRGVLELMWKSCRMQACSCIS